MVKVGHVAAAPSPKPVLATALGPLGCPRRSARPNICLNLTYPELKQNKGSVIISGYGKERLGGRAPQLGQADPS